MVLIYIIKKIAIKSQEKIKTVNSINFQMKK